MNDPELRAAVVIIVTAVWGVVVLAAVARPDLVYSRPW